MPKELKAALLRTNPYIRKKSSGFSPIIQDRRYSGLSKKQKKKEIVNFAKGIYYIPRKTFIGLSTITADTVIARRYLKWNDEVFGIYGGLKLQNMFSVTTQVPNIYEIVSNNESAKRREVKMDGRTFILRKSRFEINRDNANAYMIMELFNDLNGEKIDEFAKKTD